MGASTRANLEFGAAVTAALSSFTTESAHPPLESSFDDLLENAMAPRVGLEERLLLRCCAAARGRALVSARAGRLDEADTYLTECGEILDRPLSAAPQLIARTFVLAVRAYLCYARGEFDSARQMVGLALQLDEALIWDHDFHIMDAHRIQLVHNLMRIDLKQSLTDSVVRTSASVLRYLEGRSDALIRTTSRRGPVTKLPPSLIAALAAQVTAEAGLALSAVKDARPAFAAFDEHLGHDASLAGQHLLLVHEWLRLKDAYLDRSATARDFLGEAGRYLELDQNHASLLAQLVLLDVFRWLDRRQLEGHLRTAIKDALSRGSPSIRRLI